MYQSCEFVFAGVSSEMYGLMIYDLGGKKHTDYPFANKAKIVEERLPNRVRALHYGVRYHDEPLKFTLIFGAEEELDRYQLQEVARWLTGYQEYQWLSIEQPDLDHIRFRCLVQSLKPITVGWLPIAFEAQIICDSPYAYGYEFSETYSFNGGLQTSIYNGGTARVEIYPVMDITISDGCRNFSIENKTTGEVMRFSGLPSGGANIKIDCENRIVEDENGEYDLYNYFNFGFIGIVSGCNELSFTGSGTVKISGMSLYNVGA